MISGSGHFYGYENWRSQSDINNAGHESASGNSDTIQIKKDVLFYK